MIVPGSTLMIDHPGSWFVQVREKSTGKECTYWINGSQLSSEAVAQHVREYYRNVEVLRVEKTTTAPGRTLAPIPREHYNHGIIEKVEKVLRGDFPARPFGRKPIALKPLGR